MARNHWITEDNRFNRQAAARSCWSLVRAVILIETSFVLLYPLLYAVSVAFRPPAQLNDPVVIWIPKSLTLDNIRQVWDFIEFPKLLGNTVLIDLFSTLFQTLSCCVVGYGFARFAFKGKGLLFAVVILTIVIPPQAVTISNFMQFKQMGILDTPLAFYLPALTANGIRSGLFIFIFRQFFRGMPVEIEDAAYVDGCGPVRTFLRIMVLERYLLFRHVSRSVQDPIGHAGGAEKQSGRYAARPAGRPVHHFGLSAGRGPSHRGTGFADLYSPAEVFYRKHHPHGPHWLARLPYKEMAGIGL